MKEHDSAGGVIECRIKGVPAGLGIPVFEKLDAVLAEAIMSVGAVKAVEIGDGVKVSTMKGSENNDGFHMENGKIAKNSKDIFGRCVSIGMVSYFFFAITQNIGMTIGLMPITGITLPLVSYGGSSLLTTILSLGIVLNIGMSKKKIYF